MSERTLLSTDQLMDDNHSDSARNNLRRWDDAKGAGELWVVVGCADSRAQYPPNIALIVSIAAGGRRSPFSRLLRHPSVQGGVIASHHDGETVTTCFDANNCVCETPGGCGGRAAKAANNGGVNISDSGIGNFVDKHLWSGDLYQQSSIAASFTAERIEKTVLAGSIDHRTLRFHPLLVSMRGGRSVDAAVPNHAIMAPQHFRHELYQDGLPTLPRNEVPEQYLPYLAQSDAMADEMNERFPDLRERQATQNPSVLVLSTDIRPIGARFPVTMNEPGKVFRLSIADLSLEGTEMIRPEVLAQTLNQAEYPVAHFSNLDQIYIETKSLPKSLNAATELASQPWMQQWRQDPNHQILLGQVERGRVSQIVNFELRG